MTRDMAKLQQTQSETMNYIKRHFWPYIFGKEIETVTRMKS